MSALAGFGAFLWLATVTVLAALLRHYTKRRTGGSPAPGAGQNPAPGEPQAPPPPAPGPDWNQWEKEFTR